MRLELACVQSLMRQGNANPSALYCAVVQQGGLELPSCLREGQDSEVRGDCGECPWSAGMLLRQGA